MNLNNSGRLDLDQYIKIMFFNNKIDHQQIQRQELKRYCKKVGHQQGVVQILCMEETCKQNRLCCKFCQAEKHRTHDYILLQQNVKTPLMNLKIHKDSPYGCQHFKQLIQKIKQVNFVLMQQQRNMMEFIQVKLKIFLERFQSQFQQVAKTFNQDIYQKALYELKTCQLDDYEKQESYVKLIKSILQIAELGNANKIMEQCQKIANSICITMNIIKKDISQIFLKNQEKLRKISIKKINYKIIKQEQSQGQNIRPQDQILEFINAQDHNQINKQASIQVAKDKNKSGRQLKGVKKNKKTPQKKNKQSLKITTQKNITYEIPIHQIANNDHKFTKIQQQKPILQKEQTKSLTIQSDTSSNISNELVLEKIRDYNSLEEIRINWCYNLKYTTIFKILKRFPMLKKISFGFCKAMANSKKIFSYLQKNFPELEYFNFGLDYEHDYYKFLVDLNFFIAEINNPWSIKTTEKLLKFKRLQNIWITDCDSPEVQKLISQLKQLKSVKLGEGQIKLREIEKSDEKPKLSIEIQKILIKKTNLTCLSLQNLDLDENEINSVFVSNKDLTTIIISACQGITDKTIKVISQCCKNVSTLTLNFLKLKGKNIWQITTLKLLMIMASLIDFEVAKNGVKNLVNLELLDISFNNWVNDTFLQQLKGLNKLKALNFHHNNITDKGLQSLKDVRLEVLTCGKTLIKPEKLLQFFQSNNQIVKLCLEGLGQGNQPLRLNQQCLIKILESLPRLTHLNIRNINMRSISPFLLIKLKKLKCLTIDNRSLTQAQQKQLFEHGIDLNYQA